MKTLKHLIWLALVVYSSAYFFVAHTAGQTNDSALPRKNAPPNIVLIIGDDQGWTDFGFMGHPTIQTPRLDELAAQSLTFKRGYVPCSLCCPSLASIISGLYPHQHGIVGNDPAIPAGFFPDAESRPPNQLRNDPRVRQLRYDWLQQFDRVTCLPEILNGQADYLSFQAGKWWMGHFRDGGFTHGMTHGDPDRGGRHGDAGLKTGRDGIEPIREFLDTAKTSDRPFMLYYAPMMPHTPHNPPQRLLDHYATLTPHPPIAKYWAMCEWFDETVGELLDELQQRNLDENTIVVFITDNGWINRNDASAYAPRSKRSPFDGGLRTPIMIRWPGHVVPKMDDDHLANAIDIVPTLLAATGIHRENADGSNDSSDSLRYPGINLLDADAVASRATIYGEVFQHDVQDIENPASSLMYQWAIKGNWKLIKPTSMEESDEQEQLFDLLADPHEQINLVESNKGVTGQLRSEIEEVWQPKATAKPDLSSTLLPRPAPNIVFFLSDDQRNDALSCAGNAVVRTPMIDKLAARGVRFENAFVTTSICAASRASILTGMWERSHQYTFGTPPLDSQLVSASYPALLKAYGYRTGLIGKFGVNVPNGSTAEMFDEFQPQSQPYWNQQADGGRRHLTDICGDQAIEFLNGCHAEQPFCLSVWFNAAHAQDANKEDQYPWPPDEDGFYDDLVIPDPKVAIDYWESLPEFFHDSMNRRRWFWRWDTPEKYQRNMKAYYRLISGMDRNVGRVVRQLRRLHLDENTVIIFCSDNGYYQGSRGFAGKWTHFDESLRIPMIVFDPRVNRANRGIVRSEIVLNVDAPATILDLVAQNSADDKDSAGNEFSGFCQRRSLVDLINGEVIDAWRTDFFCEHLFDNASIPKWEGVRTERYKYARYFEQATDSEFLYDLQNDPDELVNFATDAQYTSVLEELRQRCDVLKKEKQAARIQK